MSYFPTMKLARPLRGLPRLPLARATAINNRHGTTLTFTGSTTWKAPAGASLVLFARGEGSDGTPSYGSHHWSDGYSARKSYVINGYTQSSTELGQFYGPVPTSYCDNYVTLEDGRIAADCYTYTYVEIYDGDYVPAAAGTGTSAFGRVFPGGEPALQAKPSIQSAMRISGGTSYSLYIPAGGFLTFTYI